MAGVPAKIPGTAGIVEAKAARVAQAVQWHWNVATAPPERKVRWPSAGDLGKPIADSEVGVIGPALTTRDYLASAGGRGMARIIEANAARRMPTLWSGFTSPALVICDKAAG
jgi:hypothetical protein